jgi:replicative DNA helicase
MDELRRVPHNIEAEQAVLGSILIEAACIPDVIELLGAEDFYFDSNRHIFEAIYSMSAKNEKFDPVTLQGKLREMGAFDETSTAGYIERLIDTTPTAAHVKQYAAMVRQQSVLRSLDSAASEVSVLAREPGADADEVLEAAEKKVYGIREGREVSALHKLPDILRIVYQNLRELFAQGGRIPGIELGIPILDKILGGMQKGNMIVIASRPGVGKTSFMLGMGLKAARLGKPVVFFSLEMSKEQLVSRLLSSVAKVDSEKMLTGALDPGDWKSLVEASGELQELPFYFDEEPAITVEKMKSKCRKVKGLGLVIVDYLQLVDVPKNLRGENRTAQVGDISRSLKIMSKELNVPVVCAAQLKRMSSSDGTSKVKLPKRPTLSDLRESGSIEQDADSVMLLHREYMNNLGADPGEADYDENEAECIIAKNRHGQTGKVKLHWAGNTTTFTQREHNYS